MTSGLQKCYSSQAGPSALASASEKKQRPGCAVEATISAEQTRADMNLDGRLCLTKIFYAAKSESAMTMSVGLDNLTYITILFLLAWGLCAKLLRLPLISPALGYWSGWLLVSTTSWYCEYESWLDFDPDYLVYVAAAHLFAFLGFIFADMISSFQIPKYDWRNLRHTVINFDKYSKLFLLLLFLVGLAILASQLRKFGLSLEYFTAAREDHLLRDESVIKRIGSQLGIITNVVAIIFGLRDGVDKIKVKTIALLLFASSPIGFSSASRIFLLNYTIFYVLSVLVFRSRFMRETNLLEYSEIRKLTSVLFVSLSLFSLIGFIRGGYGDDLSLIYNVMVWPSSTLSVMDDWVQQAMLSPPAHGYLTLGHFSVLFSEFGSGIFAESDLSLLLVQDTFSAVRNSALNIPRSYVPDLIFDFGDVYYVAGSFILLAVLQFTYRMLRGGDVLTHTVSVVLIYAAFMTIQNPPFTPWNIATVFWAAVLGLALQRSTRSIAGAKPL